MIHPDLIITKSSRLDVSKLRTGDIFLFYQDEVSASKKLRFAQAAISRNLSTETYSANRWVHVAIWDGAGRLWDAWPLIGVRSQGLGSVFSTYNQIQVIRFTGGEIDHIKLHAFLDQKLGADYDTSWEDIVSIWKRVSVNAPRTHPYLESREYVCSKFVDHALIASSNAMPHREIAFPLPRDFATSPEFVPVLVT